MTPPGPRSKLRGTIAVVVAGAALFVSVPAAADTPVVPVGPVGPVAPASVPMAPLPVERRSSAAMSGGIAATTIGGVLLVSGALAGVIQAVCTEQCDHTPVIIGMLAVGGTLIAVGIPLILYGSKTVPVAGGAVALVPRKPLPAWAAPAAGGGWAIRF